jgi:hypothetical protein
MKSSVLPVPERSTDGVGFTIPFRCRPQCKPPLLRTTRSPCDQHESGSAAVPECYNPSEFRQFTDGDHMALESLDKINKLSSKELARRAKEALDSYIEKRGLDHHALLVDAQFYLGELQSRKERRSRRIDIFLELIIIGMIGWEIHEGNKQATTLQQMAGNAATTADVLKIVQTTMQSMNETIQAQNSEANRILLDARYSGNWLYVTNTGHPTIFIYAVRTGNLPAPPLTPTPNVSTGQRVQLPTPQVNETIETILKTRSRYVMPIKLELTDSTGKQYVARSNLVGMRASKPGQGTSITMDNLVISEDKWRK